jgi:ParB family chromosome partitioning protein
MNAQDLALENAVWLSPEAVEPNPFQPRREFPEAEMRELTDSIRTHGVLHPIVVRPVKGKKHKGVAYQLVAGERRWRAATAAHLKLLPATVREMSDFEAATLALVENIQRNDPDDWGMAERMRWLMQEHERRHKAPMSERQLAKQLGKSIGFVRNYLGLFKLKPDVQKMVQRNQATRSSAFEIDKVSDKTLRAELIAAVDKGASFQEVKGRIESEKEDADWKRESQTPDKTTRAGLQSQSAREREAQKEAGRLATEITGKLMALGSYAPDVGGKYRQGELAPHIARWRAQLAKIEAGKN